MLHNYAMLFDRDRGQKVALVIELGCFGSKLCSFVTAHLHVPFMLYLSWPFSPHSNIASKPGVVYLGGFMINFSGIQY